MSEIIWEFRGSVSGVTCPGLVTLKDSSTLAVFWKEHAANLLPPPPPPEIDFSSQTLVMAFLGISPGAGYGVTIKPVGLRNGDLMVELERNEPREQAFAAMAASPYHAVVVPAFPGSAVEV